MSLQFDIEEYPEMWSKELVAAVEDLKNGKRNAKRNLRKFVNREISPYYYTKLIERYKDVPQEPYKMSNTTKNLIALCVFIIILICTCIFAVIYHNNAIDDAYNKGESKGYGKGYNVGYSKGYRYYEDIKDEYNFYHKHAVIVTTTGQKYHRHSCYHISGRRFYIYNTENAKAKGYTPCLDCYD